MCRSLLNALRKCTLNYSEAVCLARGVHEAPPLIPRSQELRAGESSRRKEKVCAHILAAAGEMFWLCVGRNPSAVHGMLCRNAALGFPIPRSLFFGRAAPSVAAKHK